MYVVTSIPFVRRTRATLRSAEFGFFGVWVKTRTHTPRFCGLFCSAGLFVFVRTFSRPLRTNWLIVGTGTPSKKTTAKEGTPLLSRSGCSRPRSRAAARHLELTYPIRFMWKGGQRTAPAPRTAAQVWTGALDRVS